MLYKNLIAQIPEGSIVTKNRTVFWTIERIYDPAKKYNNDKRRVIGKALENSKTQMYPNNNYIDLFPDDYQALIKEQPFPPSQSIGMYLTVRHIAEDLPLYKTLIDIFGQEDTDLLLDCAMYQIIAEGGLFSNYEEALKDKAIFSEELRSASYLENFFKEKVKAFKIHSFHKLWIPNILDHKIVTKAYLHIDSAFPHCDNEGVTLLEQEDSGSNEKSQTPVIMYAVAPDGTPIYGIFFYGTFMDSLSIKAFRSFLKDYGITVDGFCVDRGTYGKEDLDLLRSLDLDLVWLINSKSGGVASATNKLREDIQFNIEKWIDGTELFGDKAAYRLFKTDRENSYLHVFFDSERAGEEKNALLKSINSAKDKALRALKEKKDPNIPEELQEFLHLRSGRGPRTLVTEYENIQQALNEKGTQVLMTTKELESLDAYRIFHSRDSSETQYRFMKSEIGFEKYNTKNEESLTGKQFTAFIAGIIRNELNLASQKLIEETDRPDWYCVPALIKELLDIRITCLSGKVYGLMTDLSSRQEMILNSLSISKKELEDCENHQNLRLKEAKPMVPS